MKEKVCELIIETIYQCNYDSCKPEDVLTQDLGADSLDWVELVMVLEDEFNIEIDTGGVSDDTTVQDVIDLVENLTNKNNS